jgi:hypothetical protein
VLAPGQQGFAERSAASRSISPIELMVRKQIIGTTFGDEKENVCKQRFFFFLFFFKGGWLGKKTKPQQLTMRTLNYYFYTVGSLCMYI